MSELFKSRFVLNIDVLVGTLPLNLLRLGDAYLSPSTDLIIDLVMACHLLDTWNNVFLLPTEHVGEFVIKTQVIYLKKEHFSRLPASTHFAWIP